MRLRPYIHAVDFLSIKDWISDERTHALWSANRFPYPLEERSFSAFLSEIAEKNQDCPIVAEDDSGRIVGFFCYGISAVTNEGMLKFIAVNRELRGQGYGTAMLHLALQYAFEITNAKAVNLNVFSVNEAAKHCYCNAGLTAKSTTDRAFQFQDEQWGRCHMAITKSQWQGRIRRA